MDKLRRHVRICIDKIVFCFRFVDAAVDSNLEEESQMESLTTLTTPDNLQQTFVIVPAKLRLIILAGFLLWKCRFSKPRKLLIFIVTSLNMFLIMTMKKI